MDGHRAQRDFNDSVHLDTSAWREVNVNSEASCFSQREQRQDLQDTETADTGGWCHRTAATSLETTGGEPNHQPRDKASTQLCDKPVKVNKKRSYWIQTPETPETHASVILYYAAI